MVGNANNSANANNKSIASCDAKNRHPAPDIMDLVLAQEEEDTAAAMEVSKVEGASNSQANSILRDMGALLAESLEKFGDISEEEDAVDPEAEAVPEVEAVMVGNEKCSLLACNSPS
ncbi:unnamed protein product [Cyprideis torosa]|uniref:Uncharacterized protein n=1 Tax=Cyprideis torosa TaxID=163714 RepID=A0A7R8WFL7_9CRUS|nr:unnamed protein product [Cyprideis torosa]CAG0897042.1 unnamed protein product [Cyprideis torosa]